MMRIRVSPLMLQSVMSDRSIRLGQWYRKVLAKASIEFLSVMYVIRNLLREEQCFNIEQRNGAGWSP